MSKCDLSRHPMSQLWKIDSAGCRGWAAVRKSLIAPEKYMTVREVVQRMEAVDEWAIARCQMARWVIAQKGRKACPAVVSKPFKQEMCLLINRSSNLDKHCLGKWFCWADATKSADFTGNVGDGADLALLWIPKYLFLWQIYNIFEQLSISSSEILSWEKVFKLLGVIPQRCH